MYDNEYDDYQKPRSGNIQARDEVMGISSRGGKRVSDTQRDDVTQHIAACVTHGVLTDGEAAARLDAVMESKTEGDLIHLVRDLPNEAALAALKARKRLSRRASGRVGKVANWLLNTNFGRAVYHGFWTVVAASIGFVPSIVIDFTSRGHIGAVGGSLMALSIVSAIVVFAINVGFAISYWE